MTEPLPPPSLGPLQAGFAAAIRTPLRLTADGYSHQHEAYDTAVVAEMMPNQRTTGIDRLAVYNQQYWFRLLTVLQREFPLTRHRLGIVAFNRLATDYLDRFPSRHPELHHLWQDIDTFLAEDRRWNKRFLRQAARLDRIYADVFFAIDHRDFDGRSLSEEQIGALLGRPLPFQTAWHLYEEDWNNVRQRRQILSEPDDERPLKGHRRRGYWAIYRSNQRGIAEEPLDALQHRLLRLLADGQPLVEACASLEVACDARQLARVQREIQGWFSRWASLGWFRAV